MNKNIPPINIIGIPITTPTIDKHTIPPKITNNKPRVFLMGLKEIANIIKITIITNARIFKKTVIIILIY